MTVTGSTRIGVALGRRSRFRNDSGQSLLELALLLPMLIAMLLGVIELGRYAYISILVANAARAGAAYGAQSLEQSVDTLGIQAAAESDFRNQVNGQDAGTLIVLPPVISCGCDSNGSINSNSNVGPACSTPSNPGAGNCGSGTHWVIMVSVTASGTFNSLFNYPGIPSTLTVSSTATLRVPQI
jgi:Flp pilus assembly protein TadG